MSLDKGWIPLQELSPEGLNCLVLVVGHQHRYPDIGYFNKRHVHEHDDISMFQLTSLVHRGPVRQERLKLDQKVVEKLMARQLPRQVSQIQTLIDNDKIDTNVEVFNDCSKP